MQVEKLQKNTSPASQTKYIIIVNYVIALADGAGGGSGKFTAAFIPALTSLVLFWRDCAPTGNFPEQVVAIKMSSSSCGEELPLDLHHNVPVVVTNAFVIRWV